MKVELSHSQLTTIRMSLIAWGNRCESEAKLMEQWALDENLDGEKCKKNAAASRSLKEEADALLKALP